MVNHNGNEVQLTIQVGGETNAKALDRWWVSAEMDEQTLHDVYLRFGAGKLGQGMRVPPVFCLRVLDVR